jgi:hypothetical protein
MRGLFDVLRQARIPARAREQEEVSGDGSMRASCEFSQRRLGREFDKLAAALKQQPPTSFEDGEREWLEFQKKRLTLARTEGERLRARQLIAMRILDLAHENARTWEEYQRALRRVRRLGYISVQHRLSVASMTLLWASRHAPDKVPVGWAMLEDAERQLRRIRRGNFLRDGGLDVVDDVKQRVAQRGLLPPSPTGTSRRQG